MGFGILLLVVLVLSPCLVCGINGGEAKDGIAQSDTAISSRKLSHGLGICVGEIQGRNTTSSGEVVVSSKAGKNGNAGGGGGGDGSGRDGEGGGGGSGSGKGRNKGNGRGNGKGSGQGKGWGWGGGGGGGGGNKGSGCWEWGCGVPRNSKGREKSLTTTPD
ncbi:putative glycine-rich cell wall structural protein 1 [Actinidia eriantha]|uniref:putative glycine-rich cell wall structural protein 1 n=1 Tax=Actinidia eriantha TaxID=165200 RepID=UPI002584173C|nr:putative glycine-rich cell wall structural protein 1 [Actinidia eriantha]